MRKLLILCAVVASFVGCSSALEHQGPSVTLYALQPALFGYNVGGDIGLIPDPGHDLAKGYFHSYKIIGQVDLTGTAAGEELSAYLEEEASLPQGLIAGCFEPRHALRVVRDGQTSDYVVCFACQQFDWYEGRDLHWAGKQAIYGQDWEPRFSAPLTAAGIELAD